MKIALIGATGGIGGAIAKEALARKHQLTAVTRRGGAVSADLAGVQTVGADIFDAAALADAVRGNDVLASAFGPGPESATLVTKLAGVLVEAARVAGIKRVVVVGGAGSLYVAPDLQLVDAPGFPEQYRQYALAHRDALAVLRAAKDLDWTFFAPAALIAPGERRGGFSVGVDKLISNAAGDSKISYPDYADAFVTELETSAHVQQVVTAAYTA
jgi:putative NADH-flavin reductase